MLKKIAPVAAVAVALTASQAQASSFTLDFGDNSSGTFNATAGNVINYGIVANDGTTDIYGQLKTFNAFDSSQPANNGSAVGDARVNAKRGEAVQLGLSLFSDASYSTAYANAGGFEWSLVFYDIDGIGSSAGGYGPTANETNYYDEVLLRTPGTATFTDTTVLTRTQTADGLLVNAYGQKHIDGQNGIISLSEEQQDYSVVYTVQDTATVLFDYIVQDISFSDRARNLLVDGGSLELTGDTITVPVAPVPLPGGIALMLGGFAAFAALRRVTA